MTMSTEAPGSGLRAVAVALALCLPSSYALTQEPAAPMEEEAPGFFIRTAFTDLIDGTHMLYADIDYGLGEKALEALESGVPLTFEVEVKVIRQRSWMWDQTVTTLHQQYQLVHLALSDRFVLRDLNAGTQQSYTTLYAAATELGRISDMPVIADDELVDGERYEIRLRVRLVVEAFPAPMRWVTIAFPGWRTASDWYAWMLRS
jgi:hypothetical protein